MNEIITNGLKIVFNYSVSKDKQIINLRSETQWQQINDHIFRIINFFVITSHSNQ